MLCSPCSDTPSLVVALLAVGLGAAACGPGDVEQYNHPGRITSVGPVSFEDSSLLVDYTLFDREGDDLAVEVGVCPEDDQEPGVDCPTPVAGAGGDGRRRLPTAPGGEDVAHRLSWNVGCGRVDAESCVETQLDQAYVVHLRVEGTDRTVSSEPFTLGDDFAIDELPACDPSAGTIPEPCSPDSDE